MPTAWDLAGFEAWLGGRAASTRTAYLTDVSAFARWAGRGGVDVPERVDRVLLRRYLASLSTRRLARATVARQAAALRCYFSWLLRQGRLGSDPARALRAPSGGGRLPRVLSAAEVAGLLDVEAPAPVDRRDLAVLELLYAAGLRVSELCGLDRGDVDLRARTVTVIGKGAKQRRVPVHDAAVAALRAWLEGGRDEMAGPPDAVFVNRRGGRLGHAMSGGSSIAGPSPPPTPTPSATPTPRTSSMGAPTCGSCRNCSAMPAWPPPRCTRT